jgi:hypothetical protein
MDLNRSRDDFIAIYTKRKHFSEEKSALYLKTWRDSDRMLFGNQSDNIYQNIEQITFLFVNLKQGRRPDQDINLRIKVRVRYKFQDLFEYVAR